MRRAILALAVVGCVVALIIATSGTGAAPRAYLGPDRNATLMLDFTPNAVHAGIYAAMADAHTYRVDLQVMAPTASTDSIKLLETGKVDFAILDIHDLAIAREQGEDIVGIMAIVERPLSAVIAAPGIASPRDLEGKTVGITGDPSDTAVLRSVVAGSGGDPAKVKTVTIGFNAVADLLAGRVAAATAFWSDEGQAVRSRRPDFHIFRVDDYGAPSYPELVLCATRATLTHRADLAGAVVHALQSGYDFARAEPSRAAQDLEHYAPGLDPKLVSAQLAGLLPAFETSSDRSGFLDMTRLRAWARWEVRFGIVSRPLDVTRAFDPSFADSEMPEPSG